MFSKFSLQRYYAIDHLFTVTQMFTKVNTTVERVCFYFLAWLLTLVGFVS